NAPLHRKHKFLSTHLSKSLREKYGKRSLPLRKGDEVLIMRGSSRKKKAKVSSIDLKRSKITLEGMQRTKKDGTKVNVYFHPSSLQIQSLDLADKERLSALERGSKKSSQKPKETESPKKADSKEKNASKKTTSKH